jgi:hypothetical protein
MMKSFYDTLIAKFPQKRELVYQYGVSIPTVSEDRLVRDNLWPRTSLIQVRLPKYSVGIAYPGLVDRFREPPDQTRDKPKEVLDSGALGLNLLVGNAPPKQNCKDGTSGN